MFKRKWVELKELIWGMNPKPTIQTKKIARGILFGANYDAFTNKAMEWLQKVSKTTKLPSKNFKVVLKNDLSKEDLRKAMANIPMGNRLEIFCGHGISTALLGPYINGSEKYIINDVEHGPLYDISMIKTPGVGMLAFCCSAGEIFGNSFINLEGNSFLGFQEELLFMVEDDYFMNELGRIFQVLAVEVIKNGQVKPEHEFVLSGLFDDSIAYLLDGEGRHSRDSFLYQLLLIDHQDNVRFLKAQKPQ